MNHMMHRKAPAPALGAAMLAIIATVLSCIGRDVQLMKEPVDEQPQSDRIVFVRVEAQGLYYRERLRLSTKFGQHAIIDGRYETVTCIDLEGERVDLPFAVLIDEEQPEAIVRAEIIGETGECESTIPLAANLLAVANPDPDGAGGGGGAGGSAGGGGDAQGGGGATGSSSSSSSSSSAASTSSGAGGQGGQGGMP